MDTLFNYEGKRELYSEISEAYSQKSREIAENPIFWEIDPKTNLNKHTAKVAVLADELWRYGKKSREYKVLTNSKKLKLECSVEL